MNKIVRKRRQGDLWRIGDHESRFADMANEGLHLKKVGRYFVHFVKGEPKKMRYRIDVSSQEKMTPEDKEIYAQRGWDYVASYEVYNVFSSPVQRNAPELYTDPLKQADTLEDLHKELAKGFRWGLVPVILMIGMIGGVWYIGGMPTMDLVDGSIFRQLIFIMVQLYIVYTFLKASIYIKTLRKSLSKGEPIDHHAPWKMRQRVSGLMDIIFIIILILSIAMPFIQISKSESKTLPASHVNLPIVRLADIEQSPDLIPKSTYIQNDVDWSNQYTYKWSLLAPIQYESNEYGIIPTQRWKDNSGKYSPNIHTRFYDLTFPSMAEGLITDLIKKHDFTDQEKEFIEIKQKAFDILFVHEDDTLKEIFAAKGKKVMYVRYYGHTDLDLLLKSMANKIL